MVRSNWVNGTARVLVLEGRDFKKIERPGLQNLALLGQTPALVATLARCDTSPARRVVEVALGGSASASSDPRPVPLASPAEVALEGVDHGKSSVSTEDSVDLSLSVEQAEEKARRAVENATAPLLRTIAGLSSHRRQLEERIKQLEEERGRPCSTVILPDTNI